MVTKEGAGDRQAVCMEKGPVTSGCGICGLTSSSLVKCPLPGVAFSRVPSLQGLLFWKSVM